MKISLLKASIIYCTIVTFIITFFTSLLGCEYSNLTDSPLDKVSFEIVTLDKNREEADVFDAGEDIGIGLKIINRSEKTVEWRFDYTCHLFQNKDFLLVYRLNDGNETNAGYFPIGTPYEPPINCYTMNLSPELVSPGEKVLINLPWSSNANNRPLTAGQYYITATVELTIDEQTKAWDLRNGFEMK
jgi:hypothetical protein